MKESALKVTTLKIIGEGYGERVARRAAPLGDNTPAAWAT